MSNELITDELRDRFAGEAISAEKEISEKLNKAIGKESFDRRWFWELLQNAIDSLSGQVDGKLNIELKLSEIEKGNNTLTASHDGGYFKPSNQKYRFDDFKNLINPTSGKPPEDTDTVGRFGTGFLSTHRLSLKIDVRGTFMKQNEELVSLTTTLDRTSFLEKSEEARNQRIDALILGLAEYKRTIDLAQKEPNWPIAEFTYHLQKDESLNRVYIGFDEIRNNLPFVFALVDKLNSVKIYDELTGKNFDYYREPFLTLEENHHLINVKELESKDSFSILKISGDGKSILFKVDPINIESKSFRFINRHQEYETTFGRFSPSLYCTYPLIGSEKFCLPFVVHSNSFEPDETRDQIDLKKKSNQDILLGSLILYAEFLKKYSILGCDLWNICTTQNWTELDWVDKNWYEDTFLRDLRDKIVASPLIKILQSEGDKSISISIKDCFFPDFYEAKSEDSGSEKEPSTIHYELVSLLKNRMVPSYGDLAHWLQALWTGDNVQRISLNALIKDIATTKDINSFSKKIGLDHEEALKKLKDFLIVISKEKGFEKLITGVDQAIIPTVSGVFQEYPMIRKGVGFGSEDLEIDLLKIHCTLLDSKKYMEKICETSFVEILNTSQLIGEKKIADDIAIEVDNLLTKHSELVKKIEKEKTAAGVVEKNKIESNLSIVLNWISKFDGKRKYFKDSQKRRILQAIIDEKDSPHLTSMLELHRTNKVSLANQNKILSDEDLNAKLEKGQQMLDAIKDENEKFEKLKKIGKYFESLMKEILNESFGVDRVRHIDGNQDFTVEDFYFELKSTTNGNQILMHPEQAEMSQKKRANYYLAVFEYHKPHEQVTKEEFREGLRLTNEIGEKLDSIVVNMGSYESGDENVQVLFPDVYKSFDGMKKYKYVIKKAAWGDKTFDYVVNEINKII
ncbi:sacsin N-terminal ATP-binding-like domain-containing protein [Marinoscillum sp.]|uniref:sacsin N-terminal ATP-binding-like domain-containing protein n=1 Tax=Marinoscillum sp. TaxID=2024838 RepID=UPI003BAD3A8E